MRSDQREGGALDSVYGKMAYPVWRVLLPSSQILRQTGIAAGLTYRFSHCTTEHNFSTDAQHSYHDNRDKQFRTPWHVVHTLPKEGEQLYESHVPTTVLQRVLLTCGSAVGCYVAPHRDAFQFLSPPLLRGELRKKANTYTFADMIATFGETSGYYALRVMRWRMLSDETGKEILRMKPRINTQTVDLEALRKLPRGSFGREYVHFMDSKSFTPDARRAVKYVDDAELAYVMQRYRELHDFTHTLLQMPTNLYGEIVVKWFEGVQTGLPMCVLGGLLAPLRLPSENRQELLQVYVPWAIASALRASFLLNVYFERHFSESADSLRERLGIRTPPSGSLTAKL